MIQQQSMMFSKYTDLVDIVVSLNNMLWEKNAFSLLISILS
ncbi:hypothetical protein [Bacillus sp. SG-1]|nr:hypothetical protein [Bacillus sp. SG-1]